MRLQFLRLQHLYDLVVEAQDKVRQAVEFVVDPRLEVESVTFIRIRTAKQYLIPFSKMILRPFLQPLNNFIVDYIGPMLGYITQIDTEAIITYNDMLAGDQWIILRKGIKIGTDCH